MPVAHKIIPQERRALTRQLLKFRLTQTARGRTQTHIHLPLMRAKRYAQRRTRRRQQGLQPHLQRTLPYPRRAQLHIGLLGRQQTQCRQLRQNLLRPHRLQLIRRPGQHHQHLPVLLHPKSRRRPVRIRQHLAPGKTVGLLQIVIRHLPAQPGKTRLDRRTDAFLENQLLPQHLGHHFTRPVIARRTQPARGDHHIAPRPTLTELRHDRRRLVRDGHITHQRSAPTAQTRPHEGQMRVRRQPQE